MLLERDALLDELSSHLAAARRGNGSIALVAGEAGSGKTSLVEALVEKSSPRTLIMEGACDPLTTPRPLSPLVDIAADPNSGLADVLDVESPHDAFGVILERLGHSVRPVLLVIEDIHWADNGTLDFIRFIGRRVGDTKALVLCTYRDDEVGPDHPLRVVLGDLATRATTHRLSVPLLSPAAVGALAAGTDFDPAPLHRITGGNAFFVTEMLAAGSALPNTVQDAVLARVSRLNRRARKVVDAVSIAPRSLSVSLALALSGAEPADVDEALASGVLLESEGELRFRHELARSAVESALPVAGRLSDHRRMIALLGEEKSTDLARLAHHAIRAQDGGLVVRFAPRAAEQASSRGSYRESVAFYQAALARASIVDPDVVARWRIKLGRVFGILDRPADAFREQEWAVDHFRATGAVVDLANALVAVSTTRWQLGELEEGRASVREALDLLEPLGESSELARAWYCSGYHWMLARQHQKSVDALRESKRVALAVRDEATMRLAEYILGTTEIVMGDPDLGVQQLRESHSIANATNDEFLKFASLGMLGSGGGEARRYDDAIDALNRGIELAASHDADTSVTYDRAWLARIAFEQGRWDDAVRLAEAVVGGPPGRGVISPVTALGALGRVQVRRGDAEARNTLERALEVGANCEMQHVWSPYCGLAELAWLQDRADDIPDILEEIYRRALDTDSQWARGEVGYWMWKAGATGGPPDRAAEPFALQMAGSWREASNAWREIGCPYEVALALSEGDEAAMLEAIGIFDSLGARPAGSRLRSRLRDVGARGVPRAPTATTRANPAGLTRRQLEVLELMTEGLSNSEIAERLFVSRKTVEHHASAIYAKLGVGTRARAIAKAADVGVGR